MLAYMDHTAENVTGTPRGFLTKWHLDRDLTILVGAAIGALGLMLILAVAVLAWHCCCQKTVNEKEYSCKDQSEEGKTVKQTGSGVIQSESMVFVGVKNNQQYKSPVVENNNKPVLHSQMVPVEEDKGVKQTHNNPSMKPRPLSQPVHLSHDALLDSQVRGCDPSEPALPDVGVDISQVILSSIPENTVRSYYCLKDMPPLSECSSYDGLDELNGLTHQFIMTPDTIMKTRSLPAWGHSRLRPLSTEDDLNELYAKVNFSKKRKNRMRNDSAAAIAVNKSQNSFLILPFIHKDTDSLVDNEAIVVYDERTAL
ncbi:uncharacterized protein LOC106476625 [Limulus polyphemus]|uniref:Uncharacterized protein LOC106476625 n=1 Tax=Limulus polyphemus TaxID=6850 RepID=A0ABM1RXP0_LIMPO|nr:uncharacterized protein LOC106476625 [Limulus polyphemus]XP_022236142.1 uncharacterized protein LOC106476625 [Limulus polyphemus]XP_022236143.1 uncharacterized protein LOC106476625 [Limulus polyphemus]XP_022236144.1 uncharacterized protein LOC106476625 [Limulus polyphemus]XP_022236145.1 uncharacterized protein LOC106476625 [Limulus polyphemus]